MKVMPRRPLFHTRRRSNLYRMFLWACLILAVLWFIRGLERGEIINPLLATPTPTRTVRSYALEGDALFTAGQLEDAILAYQQATQADPSDPEVWAKLARIQTYSSATLTTDFQRRERMLDARYSIEQAITLAPDDSIVNAIYAFVLDWNATVIGGEQTQSLLIEAERSSIRALQLDNQNGLAMAFYAEILVDQQKWPQAEQIILQAVERNADIMDVHRVYGQVLESTGRYRQAIEEYQQAIAINPNLTFLYIWVGLNYRTLAAESGNPATTYSLYESALEYFAKAARLNEQLEIIDPLPYISIAKTYAQQGEFFIAARNMQKALDLDPENANTYGQLGELYQRSRNYEGAIPALKCAVRGCTVEEACEVRGGCAEDEQVGPVTGLALSSSSANYYLVYGALLAAFSPREPDYCIEAEDVLNQLLAAYGDDPIIFSNANESLAICAAVAASLAQTPTPIPTSTPIPTPIP